MDNTQKQEYHETKIGEFTVVDYKKAVVLKVDKEQLKKYKLYGSLIDLKGRWNQHLDCGPGWIFAGNKRKDLIDLLSNFAPFHGVPEFEKPKPIAPKPKVSDYFKD